MILYFQKNCHSMIQSFCYGESLIAQWERATQQQAGRLQPLIVPHSLRKVST